MPFDPPDTPVNRTLREALSPDSLGNEPGTRATLNCAGEVLKLSKSNCARPRDVGLAGEASYRASLKLLGNSVLIGSFPAEETFQ